jgi:hypothetical protein
MGWHLVKREIGVSAGTLTRLSEILTWIYGAERRKKKNDGVKENKTTKIGMPAIPFQTCLKVIWDVCINPMGFHQENSAINKRCQ